MSTTNQIDFRKEKGLLISKEGSVVKNSNESFTVHSQTFANKHYEVQVLESIWVCSCPDFEYRKIECCKHIYGVKLWFPIEPTLPSPTTLNPGVILTPPLNVGSITLLICACLFT